MKTKYQRPFRDITQKDEKCGKITRKRSFREIRDRWRGLATRQPTRWDHLKVRKSWKIKTVIKCPMS
jgi:hypothetical protein